MIIGSTKMQFCSIKVIMISISLIPNSFMITIDFKKISFPIIILSQSISEPLYKFNGFLELPSPINEDFVPHIAERFKVFL